MNKSLWSSLLITLSIAVLTAGLWAMLNQPGQEPPWPTRIQGFSFSPLRQNHNPEIGQYPTPEQIEADLVLLQGKVHAVRTYSVESSLAEIPRLARQYGLNVALGAWISPNVERNQREVEKAIALAKEYYRNVVRVIVGNESLLRQEITPEALGVLLAKTRAAIKQPVSTAEPWHIWLANPKLVEQVDFIAVHILPYWEGLPVDNAVDYVVQRYEELQKAYPGKPIVISEVGWPSKGPTRDGAQASRANEAKFLRRFLTVAQQKGYIYYVMEAFDQTWKLDSEGAAGAYWGVYDVQRQPKFTFTEPVVRIPHWRELAFISIGLAVLLLTLVFRDSSGLGVTGRGFLAFIVYGTATLAVWLVYDFSSQYLTFGTLIAGALLFFAMFGVIVVLLAEAHEWAEALWLRHWRRLPQPRSLPDAELPMVSIHVPAYNEPPDMMIETLNALAQLDYPHFEVLVIDNNTQDPAVWQPVEAHCATLGERFRFFHVAPLTGFKAGALNFALRHTAATAEVVAVIDSDYLVTPDWLRALVPHFTDPNIAIVQAPQDYRDGGENAFKAMCLAEYRGFFQIGMVTRNERNAIIQHGTMTMTRRRVLEEVGGWGEWCITEDAELGLRIFERGYAATYTPQGYGRGLMPDTFIDFKKQRFRWAYGAVLIMRQHLWPLFGLAPSRLTLGQRYHFIAGWLPWLADGFNLIFNLGALAYSAAMILYPRQVQAPMAIFAIFPLMLFLFKVFKMFFLYRGRVAATLRQSLAASLAGLALSHTIALAMLTGFVTRGIGFFRTPKMATANSVLKAIADAREETLMLIALLLAIGGISLHQDTRILEVQVWILMLGVQCIPYLAALVVSFISALPRLPARLIGTMGELKGLPDYP